MKTALIFGGTSQSGRYMIDLLKQKGYRVIATCRASPLVDAGGDEVITPDPDISWRHCDLTNYDHIYKVFTWAEADEIYNFTAINVEASWRIPSYAGTLMYGAVANILDLIKKTAPNTKFFNSGSASVFDNRLKTVLKSGYGSVVRHQWATVQYHNESSKRLPHDPYGAAKLAAENLVRVYREEKGLFACTGIFFNMESPLRRGGFCSYVIREALRLKRQIENTGTFDKISVGPLYPIRDYGWTPDFMKAVHLMMQTHQPDDYVIGTGQQTAMLNLVEEVLDQASILPRGGVTPGFDHYVYSQEGTGGVDAMCADTSKIQIKLGWKPQYTMKDIVRMLLDAEFAKGPVKIG